MAADPRSLTGPAPVTMALVCPTAVGDPVLHWLCRNLNRTGRVAAKVFVPADSLSQCANLNSWMAANFSTRTEWDRVAFFCKSPEDGEANVEMAYMLNAASAVLVDPQTEDEGFANLAPRLSYALETNIEILGGSDAVEMNRSFPFVKHIEAGPANAAAARRRRVTFFSLMEEQLVSVRAFLDNSYNPFSVNVLTTGSAKSALMSSGFSQPIFNISECCPHYVLSKTDLLVDLSESVGGDLHAWVLADARSAGIRAFVRWSDRGLASKLGCLTGGGSEIDFCASLVGLISGDPELRSFAPPSASEYCVSEGARNVARIVGDAAERTARPSLVVTSAPKPPSRAAKQVLMMAINGHGLGHAQRVSAIAGAVRSKDPGIDLALATYPTCFEFVGARGHKVLPLVGRPVAQNDKAIEVANLKRMRPVLSNADMFVFDGGHPYDGVVALLQEFTGESIWVRRGLWQPMQENQASHEREKYFSHVVRPLEAFEELNFASRHGSVDEHAVGPIVAEPEQLDHVRDFLRHFRETGKRVVVTMLGSGQAGNRGHLSHFVCRHLETYDDVINFLIVWPQDKAHMPSVGYRNTVLAQTVWGTAFVKEADLLITACGYNTFHECLYLKTPALYIPQSAGWLDDQERRAEAAAERGVAVVVGQDDVVGLRNALDELLLSNRLADLQAAFAELELPARGSEQIAEMITNGFQPPH